MAPKKEEISRLVLSMILIHTRPSPRTAKEGLPLAHI